MKLLLPCLLLSLIPFISFTQQTINGTITHDGLEREYILYVPSSYVPGSPAPLIFNFHGYTSNAASQMGYGDFRPIADTAGFLVVHPMGTLDNNGITHWNVGWGGSTVDDVGFTAALIDALALDYDINLDRVYSTGMSNGGFMSYKLACELSDRIAAIASVTGSMNAGQFNQCDPEHPMPVMEIHGTADAVVSYYGANWIEATEDVVEYWADFNNCNPDPVVTDVPNTNILDGSTVDHFIYENGDNGVEVELFKVINGGHTWPGTAFPFGGTNYDIDASAEIWRFFSQYDINGRIMTTAVEPVQEDAGQIRVYPNPVRDRLNIERLNAGAIEYSLMSPVGKKLLKGVVSGKSVSLGLGGLAPGVYFLRVGEEICQILKI